MNQQQSKTLPDEAAEYVATVRTARRNARKPARSGNPAISAPARSIIRASRRVIATVYDKYGVSE